jgi:hypothetical protein
MHANWSGVPYRVMRAVLGKNSEAGHGIIGSPTDQHSAPYALTEEFTSVYRLHPLIPDEMNVRWLDATVEPVRCELVNMQGRFTRQFMQQHGFTNLLYSFGTAYPGAIRLYNYPNFLRQFRKDGQPLLDVAAIDIMRDRERGVPRYNRFRELLGKQRVRTFEDITSIPGAAAKMREIYKDVDRVDLLVGLLAEDLPKGFGFSDTAFRIFILMASRRLKSDRFFTDDYRPEIYTDFGLDWIRNNGLQSVLLRHVPQLGPALEGLKNCFFPWNVL